jgi:hypothetical protein
MLESLGLEARQGSNLKRAVSTAPRTSGSAGSIGIAGAQDCRLARGSALLEKTGILISQPIEHRICVDCPFEEGGASYRLCSCNCSIAKPPLAGRGETV